jgi:hypothetical protein
MDKRTFLKGLTLAGVGSSLSTKTMAEWIARFHHSPGVLAEKEDFWGGIRSGYRLKPDYINLENGYYNIQPEEILTAFISHVR